MENMRPENSEALALEESDIAIEEEFEGEEKEEKSEEEIRKEKKKNAAFVCALVLLALLILAAIGVGLSFLCGGASVGKCTCGKC